MTRSIFAPATHRCRVVGDVELITLTAGNPGVTRRAVEPVDERLESFQARQPRPPEPRRRIHAAPPCCRRLFSAAGVAWRDCIAGIAAAGERSSVLRHGAAYARQLQRREDCSQTSTRPASSRRGPADLSTGTVWTRSSKGLPRRGCAALVLRAARAPPGTPIRWARPARSPGRVALWGGPVREIRPGDTVWIAPGEKHWHGAGPDTAMLHIALQESLDGNHVTWLEHVTDEQYGAKVGG
jgi:hypothetical protein